MNKLFFASCAAFVYKWEPRYILPNQQSKYDIAVATIFCHRGLKRECAAGSCWVGRINSFPRGEGGGVLIKGESADHTDMFMPPSVLICWLLGDSCVSSYHLLQWRHCHIGCICLTFLRCARIHASCRCKVCRCYILDLGAEDHFILFLDKSSGALNVMGGDRRRFCKIPKPVQLSFGGTFPTLRRELAKHCAHCENIHFPHCTLLIVLSSL